MQTAITQLFGIQYPVVQAGMIWCSGWRLASAVSNAGGLGLLGAGSMYPDIFLKHVKKMQQATNKPWGVNLPLLYPQMDEIIEIVLREKVGIVFTSAGSPKKYTGLLKGNGIKVAHVIANAKFAVKAHEAGVDAIVAEGFEAGGHNGIEETTTMNLIPLIRQTTDRPLIAAGGIGTGSQMLAALALGADGVQIGSRFAASVESSAHETFKQKIITAKDGDTMLTLKSIVPVRLIKNAFYYKVKELEDKSASEDELKQLLGRGRAKLGMFEGNDVEGELEIGQVAALINEIKPAAEILNEIIHDFNAGLMQLETMAGIDQ
jgi:enoyl-[acyl-carrier protein] reductase II